MRSTDAVPPYETQEIGTPRDYTSDMYRFYFEVGEHAGKARNIITNFLGEERAKTLIALPHGYEMDLPIQCVPDLLRDLVQANIAVYQVVRVAKLLTSWD